MTRGAAALGMVAMWLANCTGNETGGICDSEGTGTLAAVLYGEEFIEEVIPASEVVDGWEIRFDSFLLHLSMVEAGIDDCPPGLRDTTGRVYDLTEPSARAGHDVVSASVPSGRYDQVSYRIGPASSASTSGNAGAADLAMMQGQAYSIYVAGTASHPVHGNQTFAWGVARDTLYESCESQADVTAGSMAGIELTIHGDHLFYDDLVSPAPNLAFDLIDQADSSGDGETTPAELAAQSIIGQSRYGVGNFTEVTNLWQFIEHLAGTLGHIDGEGHCTIAAPAGLASGLNVTHPFEVGQR